MVFAFEPYLEKLEPYRIGRTQKVLEALDEAVAEKILSEPTPRVEMFVSLITTAGKETALRYINRAWEVPEEKLATVEISSEEVRKLVLECLATAPASFDQICRYIGGRYLQCHSGPSTKISGMVDAALRRFRAKGRIEVVGKTKNQWRHLYALKEEECT